jgi:hypothetical protein
MKSRRKSSNSDEAVRRHLIELLRGGQAHATFDQAVKRFPLELVGKRPKGSPHSAWELLEHLRLAQSDILRFSQSADYVSPPWPEGYWPATPAPDRASQWAASVRKIRKDLAEFETLIADPTQDLYRPFAWGDGQTLLREALLIADHNSYHVGQLILVRKMVEK